MLTETSGSSTRVPQIYPGLFWARLLASLQDARARYIGLCKQGWVRLRGRPIMMYSSRDPVSTANVINVLRFYPARTDETVAGRHAAAKVMADLSTGWPELKAPLSPSSAPESPPFSSHLPLSHHDIAHHPSAN